LWCHVCARDVAGRRRLSRRTPQPSPGGSSHQTTLAIVPKPHSLMRLRRLSCCPWRGWPEDARGRATDPARRVGQGEQSERDCFRSITPASHRPSKHALKSYLLPDSRGTWGHGGRDHLDWQPRTGDCEGRPPTLRQTPPVASGQRGECGDDRTWFCASSQSHDPSECPVAKRWLWPVVRRSNDFPIGPSAPSPILRVRPLLL
jgi:hypothetical protein